MEFGLQKTEKVGSPALVGNPRKRIEAKAYRARDRGDNGWFRHDSGTPENSPTKSPMASPLHVARGQSKQVLGNLPQLCVSCSCAKQAQKLQQHIVAAGVPSERVNVGQSPNKIHSSLPESAARLQQQIYPSCSIWYRHEHTVITSDAEEEQKNERDQCRSPRPTWWHSDQARAGQFSPQSRRVCAEAEGYWKRNHDGSAKDWYRHERTFVEFEEKENEVVDVNVEAGASSANEFESSAETAGHACYVCGRRNMAN